MERYDVARERSGQGNGQMRRGNGEEVRGCMERLDRKDESVRGGGEEMLREG